MRRRRYRRNPDPTELREVIPGVLRGLKSSVGPTVGRAREVWPSIVGDAMAGRTRITSLAGGVLTVEVASAALKHDLATFRCSEVLEALAEKAPELGIRSVKYRVGAVS